MADTMAHSASTTRNNTNTAIGILVLALAPQIFELLWSFGTIFGLGGGRGPLQVLLGHGTALLAAPGALFGAPGSSEGLLALIYTYPLLAVAIATRFVKVRSPQDYIGGVALIALALFALWASSDLQGMRGFSFGAGTAPRMFSLLLLGLGVAVTVVGVLTDGPHLATYAWRGPLFVSLSILSFAVTIRPMGMIFAALASFMIAACGTPETRWLETLIVGICLTAFCSLLFPYALGLPLQLWPSFLIR